MGATAGSVRAGRAFVELSRDDSKLLRGLRQTSAKFKAWGATLTQMGSKFFGAGLGAALPLGLSVKTFAAFDDGMRAVKAVTQATAEEFDRLTNTAKRLGATTSFTAGEVAALMVELGRAGFKPSEVDAMTASVLNLARATGTDAAISAGIVAASLRQFGLEAMQGTRVADALTAAANKSFNTVESLGESLSYAGPAAADANMSLEETLALLGALGNVGILGSNAGTALRRLTTLSGAEAANWDRIFGVNPLDAAGNIRPLVDVLGEINDVTKDIATGDRAKKFNEAFGLLGITGASAIGKSAVSAKTLLKDIEAASGIAATTAKEMDAGLGGSFRKLYSAVEGVAIAFGAALAPAITVVADALAKVSGWVTSFVSQYPQVATTIAAAVAGVLAIGAGLIALGIAAKLAAVGLGAVIAVIGVLATPLGAIAAGLIGATAYMLAFTETGHAVLAKLGAAFDVLKTDALTAFAGIKDAMATGDWSAAAQILWVTLQIEWQRGVIALKDLWNSVFDHVTSVGADMFDYLADVTSPILKWLGTSWSEIGQTITGVFSRVVEAGIFAFSALQASAMQWRDTLKLVALSIGLQFVRQFEQIKYMITEVIPTALGWLAANGPKIVAGMLIKIYKLSMDLMKRLWEIVKDVAPKIFKFVWEVIKNGGDANNEIGKQIKGAFLRGFSQDVEKTGGPKFRDRVKSDLELRLEADQAALSGRLGEAIQKQFEANKKEVDDLVQKLGDGVTTFFEGIGDTAAAKNRLDDLQKERDRLLALAKAKRAAEAGRAAGGPAGPPPTPDLDKIKKGLAAVGAAGGGVRGTFSGDAAARFGGGGSAAERTAKSAEQLLEIQRRALRLIQRIDRDGGAGFAR